MDWTNIFIAIVGSGILNVMVTYILNRRQTDAGIAAADAATNTTLADTAQNIMKQALDSTFALNRRVGELDSVNIRLETELKELKAQMQTQLESQARQIKEQARVIEELRKELTNLKLVLRINIEYIKRLGEKPPVDIADLETMSTEALTEIVEKLQAPRAAAEPAAEETADD